MSIKNDINGTCKRNMNISIFAQNKYFNLCHIFLHIKQHNETCDLNNCTCWILLYLFISTFFILFYHISLLFSPLPIPHSHSHIIRLNVLYCGDHIYALGLNGLAGLTHTQRILNSGFRYTVWHVFAWINILVRLITNAQAIFHWYSEQHAILWPFFIYYLILTSLLK